MRRKEATSCECTVFFRKTQAKSFCELLLPLLLDLNHRDVHAADITISAALDEEGEAIQFELLDIKVGLP